MSTSATRTCTTSRLCRNVGCARAGRLREAFAGYRALAVTHDALLAYAQARQQEGAANATINRELAIVSRALTLAAESASLTHAPKVRSLREDNARPGFFERADFQAVLKHLKDNDVRDSVEWFFWTGMRPEEIRSLTWGVDDLRAVMERRLRARRLDFPLIFHRAGQPMGELRAGHPGRRRQDDGLRLDAAAASTVIPLHPVEAIRP